MSWFKAVSYSSDDVFDECGDELSLQRKEWTSNMKKRVRDGFVDGADAGEDAALQVGFNMGFREGAAQTVAVGRLKGIVSAVWCWCQIVHPEKPVPASVTELLLQVSQYEDKMIDDIRKAFENPPPSVSDVSESMEDLEVEQADQGCCGGGCEKTGCCRKEEKMDLDVSHQPQKPSSGSTDCSSVSGEGLTLLLQHSVDVVSELGLPQELISHILELKNM
ncbi:yae1 domain-containing protein 1 [Seriola lalandi dorsalis]|uniref:OTU deubiquitinase with linear linkage specificity a n=1 Tax=Seriola lalandi dorsalis TaxID=1841481 RepID=A0A3B4YM41_SERLL|nr:yae1 domain-containing protein 1 [Seriola lalandi dorsalis]XP_056220439.1 OTU deubiquitinase with linear linkage specificity a [Seriola aureovittata]